MSFFSLIRRLSKKDCNPVEFDKDAKEWVKLFISRYQKKDATPYILWDACFAVLKPSW